MFSTAAPTMGGLEPGSGSARTAKHIAYLDGLRAIAVLSVFFRHAWGLSGSPVLPFFGTDLRFIMVMLGSGVDLFFVLSGYLLARSFLRARQTGEAAPSYRVYWRARIRRIGPPYWVVLFLVVLLLTGTFIPTERVFSLQGLAIFLAHVGIMQAAYLPSFGAYSVETPFWTLTIEIIFYLMLPFMVRLFFGKRWLFCTPLLAAVALVWLYLVRNSLDPLVSFVNGPLNVFPPFPEEAVRFFLSHQMPAFLVDFTAGILAALVVTSKKFALRDNALFQRLTSPTMGVAVFFAGVLVVLGAMWRLGNRSLANNYADPLQYMNTDRPADLLYYYMETIPFGVGFGLMLCGLALATGWLQRVFSFKPLAYVGVIGYSVYLLHMPLLYVINNYGWLQAMTNPKTHFLALLAVAGPAVFLISTAFFRTVERPAMDWSRRAHLEPDSGQRGRQEGAEPVAAEADLPAPLAGPATGPGEDKDVSWAVDDAVPGEYDRVRREEQVRS
jgi:peptidoglycan/LPS O-acetylase OafA/YrhL